MGGAISVAHNVLIRRVRERCKPNGCGSLAAGHTPNRINGAL